MMAIKDTHSAVFLNEAIEALCIKPDGVYVDATFGRGGHSRAILARLGPEGILCAMDKDPEAIHVANELFATDSRFSIENESFAALEAMADRRGLSGKVNGVLFDLGVSSPQLDNPARGFSFQKAGPLDMRMNPDAGVSAAEWIATVSERDLTHVLRVYGEERYAKRIARAIIRERQIKPIATTKQLAAIVAEANPAWEHGKDPATRSFQAIRIFINHELDDLELGLYGALKVLAPDGRMVVISFHSLEDRVVKNFIRDQARGDNFPPGLPVTADQLKPTLRAVGSVIKPSDQELASNIRSRSAKMRVAERLA